jgi:hypothetical protein
MPIEKIEICVNCGTIGKKESKSFKCHKCGCYVSIVVSKEIFQDMVEKGLAKKE